MSENKNLAKFFSSKKIARFDKVSGLHSLDGKSLAAIGETLIAEPG